MEFLLPFAILALILVVPVMLAAKMLNAGNSGFLMCLLAVVIGSLANHFAQSYVEGGFGWLLGYVAQVVVYSLLLRAGFIQSLLISLLAAIIQFGGLLALGMLGLAVSI